MSARTHLWSNDFLPEFRLGLENLRAHKLRSLLTMMGMIVLAFGVSVAIGIVFGLYPAVRASRLDPVKALHYE